MKYRSSVLYDFQDEEALDFDFRKKLRDNCLVSDDDLLEFEGDQQVGSYFNLILIFFYFKVVKLTGNIDKGQFVTGNVVGLYGRIIKSDYFEVKEVIFPSLAIQIKWPLVEKDWYNFSKVIFYNIDFDYNNFYLYLF